MTALVGAVLCIYLLVWWVYEVKYIPHRDLMRELREHCERCGHQWGPEAPGPLGEPYRTCQHCKRQEHMRAGRWPEG